MAIDTGISSQLRPRHARPSSNGHTASTPCFLFLSSIERIRLALELRLKTYQVIQTKRSKQNYLIMKGTCHRDREAEYGAVGERQ